MKNIFRAFGAQNNSNEQTAEVELNEQDLEQVTGAHGHGCDYDDDYCDYDDDDYCHRHHHHRHHHHHHHDC